MDDVSIQVLCCPPVWPQVYARFLQVSPGRSVVDINSREYKKYDPPHLSVQPRKPSIKRRESDGCGIDRRRSSAARRESRKESRGCMCRSMLQVTSSDTHFVTATASLSRRVSFPEQADQQSRTIGEADWDYDRSPIEVDRRYAALWLASQALV
jgi:hypothetical protein